MAIHAILGTEKGGFLLRGDADRRSWTLSDPLFKGWKVTASAQDADGRTYVATASQVYGPAIHVSDDLDTWRQLDAGPAWAEGSERALNQVWTLLADRGRVFAGVDDAGLFVSDDRGATWRSVEGLNEHPTRSAWYPGAGGLCAHALLVDPADAQRMWVGISAVGVLRSLDGGASWAPCNEGIPSMIEDSEHAELGRCVHGLVADPDDADRIWRREHNGMFRSTDGGEHWERIEEGLGSWFGFPIARDPRTGALYDVPLESDEYRLPAGGALRVYRSLDDGDSWHALENGLPQRECYAGVLRGGLALDRCDPCGVYLGTTSGSVYVSADGGESFQALGCSLPRILSVEVYGD